MTTLREQAQAEQRREYGSVWDVLVPEVGRTVGWIIDGVIDDVVAAHTRVVTTVAELDALPVESVVIALAGGAAWQRLPDGLWTLAGGAAWQRLPDGLWTGVLGTRDSSRIYLPARVLYDPEEG